MCEFCRALYAEGYAEGLKIAEDNAHEKFLIMDFLECLKLGLSVEKAKNIFGLNDEQVEKAMIIKNKPTSPVLKSCSELQDEFDDIMYICNTYDEPVFITKDGEIELAVLSIENYKKLKEKNETTSNLSVPYKTITGYNSQMKGYFKQIQ